MQRKDILTLAIAVGSGLIAFFLMMQQGQHKTAPVVLPNVVAAASDIAKDQTVTDDMVLLAPPPPGANIQDHFLQKEDVAGLQAVEAITKGALITRPLLRRQTAESLEKVAVPDGMREYKISVNSFENLPDETVPGSWADIIVNVLSAQGQGDLTTIYRGALIVAMKRDDDKRLNAVTLGLLPEGVEVIARAVSRGKISLMMLPAGSGAPTPEIVAPTEVPSRAPGVVEIIRGVTKEHSTAAASNSRAGQSGNPLQDVM